MNNEPPHDEMEQARAARTYLDARYPRNSKGREQAELDAFMAIFHPDHDRIVLGGER
jgi:hypothetical protein